MRVASSTDRHTAMTRGMLFSRVMTEFLKVPLSSTSYRKKPISDFCPNTYRRLASVTSCTMSAKMASEILPDSCVPRPGPRPATAPCCEAGAACSTDTGQKPGLNRAGTSRKRGFSMEAEKADSQCGSSCKYTSLVAKSHRPAFCWAKSMATMASYDGSRSTQAWMLCSTRRVAGSRDTPAEKAPPSDTA